MKSEVEYSGLSESEVLASRERYGENILTPPARTPMWKLFLEKFSVLSRFAVSCLAFGTKVCYTFLDYATRSALPCFLKHPSNITAFAVCFR